MIKITHRGNFNKTEKFFSRSKKLDHRRILEAYAEKGVSVLSSATPKDTGKTAGSWDYNILITRKGYKIVWSNTHVSNGVVIAIIIQYGHGTRNGGYVQGRDFINPAMRPVFDGLATDIWKEVTSL